MAVVHDVQILQTYAHRIISRTLGDVDGIIRATTFDIPLFYMIMPDIFVWSSILEYISSQGRS